MNQKFKKDLIKYVSWTALYSVAFYFGLKWVGYADDAKLKADKVQAYVESARTAIQSGDVIFQTSQSGQSKAIQLAQIQSTAMLASSMSGPVSGWFMRRFSLFNLRRCKSGSIEVKAVIM